MDILSLHLPEGEMGQITQGCTRDRKEQRLRVSAFLTELSSADSVMAPQTHLLRPPPI